MPLLYAAFSACADFLQHGLKALALLAAEVPGIKVEVSMPVPRLKSPGNIIAGKSKTSTGTGKIFYSKFLGKFGAQILAF
jgi:hypothetical protein